MRTYTHDAAAALLRSVPEGGCGTLPGRHVCRVSPLEWEIDYGPALRLLPALDRLMGPAERSPYRFPRRGGGRRHQAAPAR